MSIVDRGLIRRLINKRGGDINNNSEKPSDVEGYPMRAWTVRIHLVDENGKDIPASLFEKATYKLHPSFKTPVHSKSLICSPRRRYIRGFFWGVFGAFGGGGGRETD